MRPEQIVPGLWRWTAPHPDWRPGAPQDSPADWERDVGCVLCELPGAAVFIDPLLAPDAARFWRWADARVRAAGGRVWVLTTIAFHRRSRDAFVERYGGSTSRARAQLPGGEALLSGGRPRRGGQGDRRAFRLGSSLASVKSPPSPHGGGSGTRRAVGILPDRTPRTERTNSLAARPVR